MNPQKWVDEHGDYLFAYAMSRLGDRDLAEELVQDALLTALQRRETFAGQSTLRTWLCGILRYKILQHLSASTEQNPQTEDASLEKTVEGRFNAHGIWKSGPLKWSADADDPPQAEEFYRVFQQCLDRLPARTAEAFMLSEKHDLETENLCNIMNISRTNLYVMLYRARTALRECLERKWFGRSASKSKDSHE